MVNETVSCYFYGLQKSDPLQTQAELRLLRWLCFLYRHNVMSRFCARVRDLYFDPVLSLSIGVC